MIEKFLNLVIYLSLVIIGSILLYLLRKSKLGIKIGLIVFFVLITVIAAYGYTFLNNKSMEPEQTIAASTTCYWVGDTNPAVWNDASHWDADSGGAGGDCDGGVVPGSDDTAVFNSANTNSVTIDTTVTVAAITNTGDYSGTMDGNTNNVNVSGNFRWGAGALDLDTGTWTVSGDWNTSGTTITKGSSTVVLNGTTKNLTTAAGNTGNFQNLTIDGSYTTAVTGSGVYVYGALTVNLGKTLSINGASAVVDSKTAPATIVLNGTIDGTGTLFLENGSIGIGGTVSANVRYGLNNINVTSRTYGGNLAIRNSGASERTATLTAGTLSVAGDFNILADGAGNTVVNGADNDPTVNITGSIDFTGVGAGSESVSLGDGTWTVGGNIDLTAGSITPNASTVIMNAADTDNTITSAGSHFNNLQFNNAAGRWSFSDAANVDGNLTVTTSETVGNGVNLNNQAVTITGNLQIDAGKLTCGSSTVQFGGNFVHNGGTFVANTSVVKMTGGSKSVTANNTVFATFWDAGSDVNTASGTFSVSTLLDLDRTFNFSGTIKMLAGSTTDVAISSAFGGGGTLEFYDSAGANLTGAGSIRCDFIKFITESANATIPAFSYGPGVNTIYATNTSSSNYSIYLGTGAGQSLSFTTSNFRVQTTGTGNLTLDAATYDPNVTITGNNLTMLKSSTGVPSISLGDGNWTISGNVDFTDGTVTPNNSTVIFTASDTDNTITSASQHFNNIQFNNAAGRWAFQDTTNIDGNFTVTTSETVGAGVNLNGRTINITGNFAMAAGKVTAGGANTITVGGSWDSSGGSGFIPNTSTVDLTGTGNLTTKSVTVSPFDFYNVKLAHDTKTTTLGSNVRISNIVNLYTGGTVTANALMLYKSDGDPFVNTGATISSAVWYRPTESITVAGQNFGGTLYYNPSPSKTITLSSDVSTAGSLEIYANGNSALGYLDVATHNISCLNLYVGAADQPGGAILGSGTHTISGNLKRLAGATVTTNTIDFGTSNTSVGGNIDFTGITVTPGGTVTMNGSGAQSITSYNGTSTQAFNNLTITNVSGAGVTFADSATVNGTFADNASDSKVTFNAGSTYAFAVIDIDGTSSHPVTLTSNNAVPGTAGNTRWNFNVADAAPTVSYVTVYDSNAAGGSEIDATNNGTDGGNNVDWNFVSFVPPTNDSLTFTNPSASNIAIADDNTEWNFRAVVTDNNGLTDMNYVELRLANAADSTLPYDSLKFRWTEATDAFSEIADTQNAATLTSTGADSSSAGNTWTLNFKVKLNDNFLAKNTDYSAELYSLSDSTLSADTDYANFYEVTSLSLSLGLSSTSINYGDLRPGTPVLGSTTATVNTNALNGYTLSISDGIAGDDSALVNSSGLRIKDYLSLISNPSLWSGTGLGFCVFSGTNKEAKWGTGATFNDANNKYAGIPQAATEIHAKAGAPTVADATGIGFKLDVPITQAAGIYTGSVTITALPAL